MSNVTGLNVSPGSGAEKIWWGIVLCLTGLGALIGIPMIIMGIVQNCQGSSTDYSTSIARKERLYGVAPERKRVSMWETTPLPPRKTRAEKKAEKAEASRPRTAEERAESLSAMLTHMGKQAYLAGNLEIAKDNFAEADRVRREAGLPVH